MMAKTTKDRANYTAATHSRVRCGTCLAFAPPRGCEIVRGDISADFVCDFWEEDAFPVKKSWTPEHE